MIKQTRYFPKNEYDEAEVVFYRKDSKQPFSLVQSFNVRDKSFLEWYVKRFGEETITSNEEINLVVARLTAMEKKNEHN